MKNKTNKMLLISALCSCLAVWGCGDKNGGGGSALPTISINSVSKFEGNDNSVFDFKVRLSPASDASVRVDYTTEGSTAAAEEDFVSQAGTLEFAPGEVDKTISIQIVGDSIKEPDETFFVVLSNPQNATIATDRGTGSIRNDDTFVPIAEDGYITPEEYAGWTKIWADEFEGSELDLNHWTHELGNHGWGNNELQNYTNSPANSYLSDGHLIIEARKESSGGSDYSSARIITADKFEFAFGRVDIRARLPEGQGIWPALWMLGANFWDIGWPACGEIDIMELIGQNPDIVHGTAHWGIDNSNHQSKTASKALPAGQKFSDEFHVFSIIWEPNRVEWYVDDVLINTLTPADMNGQPYPFNNEFFFIFNIAVGGNWPGSPDASTVFPQQMVVDYIRVFQQ
ncbi:MAG: glycosyl hydrolase family protein [Bacteroidetes bacterium]|nr:MAG: glycosyl hydrolase family protein [Bacteroidota bacterium]